MTGYHGITSDRAKVLTGVLLYTAILLLLYQLDIITTWWLLCTLLISIFVIVTVLVLAMLALIKSFL